MSVLDRRRADELARALDRAAAGIAPDAATWTAPVALAQRVRGTGTTLERTVAPRPEFRAALRTRLVAVATVQPVTAAPPTRARRGTVLQKGAAVAAGALASVVAVSGVAVASSEALPGDPFYGVKRAAEDVQLRLAGDATDEGTRHLQFAATRLDELTALTLGRDGEGATPDWDLVRQTLADMDVETLAGTRLLEDAWRDSGDRGALDALSGFAAEQAVGLQALLPVMAPTVLDAAQASLGLVSQVATVTEQLLTGAVCGPACTKGTAPGGASDPSCDCPVEIPATPGTGEPSLVPGLPGTPPGVSPEPSAAPPSSGPSEQPSSPSPSPSPSSGPPAPTPLPTLPPPSPLGTPLPSAPVTSRLPGLSPALPSVSPQVTTPDTGSVLPDLPTG